MTRIRFGFRPASWTSRATWLVASCFVLAGGCAGRQVPPPAPGTTTLFGTVRLLPHEGLSAAPAANAYADRALRDAELVSYAKPGFAVVTAEGLASPRGNAELRLHGSRFGTRFEPRYVAVGEGGVITVRNEDQHAHVISCPAHGVLTSLEPGAATEVVATITGEVRWFVLDAAAGAADPAEASVYVAEGPHAVVASDGQWLLEGLRPTPAGLSGTAAPIRLRVWHPRFPPALRAVELEPDRSQRIDFELQVR